MAAGTAGIPGSALDRRYPDRRVHGVSMALRLVFNTAALLLSTASELLGLSKFFIRATFLTEPNPRSTYEKHSSIICSRSHGIHRHGPGLGKGAPGKFAPPS